MTSQVPDDAETMSLLVQEMACRLFGTKPLSEPILAYCQLTTENKFQWNLNQNTKIVMQENEFKYRLQNVGHFVPASMWWYDTKNADMMYMPRNVDIGLDWCWN